MKMLQLAYANLKEHFLTTALSIMLLSIGVGMVSFIVTVSEQLNDRFNRDIRGIDMVVGAKGSPLQLILSAVYQIDNPTGNISLSEVSKIQRHPLVKYSIPLSYGDSYQGFRIVGTDTLYLSHFKANFQKGQPWNKSLEVVLGSTVAERLSMGLGGHFHGTHGFEEEGHAHEEMRYSVVGILEPTGTVADRLILTSTESVWDIHHHEEEDVAEEEHANEEGEEDDHHEHEEEDAGGEITALLVKFKNPMGLMQLPRFINEKTSMQAALPAIEINRLYELMGIGFSTLQAIGILIMIIAALSVFISLLNSLKERKYELALMRSLGASPVKLFSLVIQESLLLCLAGYAFGIILGRIAIMTLSSFGEEQFHFSVSQSGVSPVEIWLLPFTLGVGLIAAIIPAIRAYRSDISTILRNE
ncbi:MAG: ABC transporter permease [Flavobacteriales bacterium]|nr:ABC transporter permease [Flavobacteriales bacterium]MCB9190114.1 ABC transporter permease [Flavobacteriales bacterium]MCB9205089.1 ABC transporter permease [Flavobacteriales bacterium]